MAARSLTVADLFEAILPSRWRRCPKWPPDAFALISMGLEYSGAYVSAVNSWPPSTPPAGWAEEMRGIAAKWRRAASGGQPAPPEVRSRWTRLVAFSKKAVRSLSKKDVAVLLELLAICDEACNGIGVAGVIPDFFDAAGTLNLLDHGTLCRSVSPSRVRVLPKLHTPQKGMTLRSFSHYLALCDCPGVTPRWLRWPFTERGRGLNLLLVPWPLEVQPSQFVPCASPLGNMDADRYGFVEFHHRSSPRESARRLDQLLTAAKRIVDDIDGIVLPELAVSDSQYDKLVPVASRHGAFLVAGVGKPMPGAPARNMVRMTMPPPAGSIDDQFKHHRWALDRRQIENYGLGGQLDPDKVWWEHITLEPRTLGFVSISPDLTFSVLICEDLARQEPVAKLVRSVGPNLVIALLMDGPQLSSRWPAQYATVLADDPGCSVLTLTSVGMSELSRPPGMASRSRTIALWKDVKNGALQLDLPPRAEALILSLSMHREMEWAADGRNDGGTASYPLYAGLHPVELS